MKLFSKEQYIDGVLSGNRRMLAKTITLIESRNPEHEKFGNGVIEKLLPHIKGNSIRLGISGVPGVGKSTLIEALGQHIINQGKRVAVLAVDPSSQKSKGSILGDKTRMDKLSANKDAFIRPSPSSGSLGGVARMTRETMLICEAAGYDVIIIETVGVGQSEVMVASMVDFFLVMMLPNAGDELQGIKKGIMEFADTILINKVDGENETKAKIAKRQYENALHILKPDNDAWSPKTLLCSALKNTGVKDFWDVVTEHHQIMTENGYIPEKRKKQRKEWMWNILQEALQSMLKRNKEVSGLADKLEDQVLNDTTTPTKAASLILDKFMNTVSKADSLWDLIND